MSRHQYDLGLSRYAAFVVHLLCLPAAVPITVVTVVFRIMVGIKNTIIFSLFVCNRVIARLDVEEPLTRSRQKTEEGKTEPTETRSLPWTLGGLRPGCARLSHYPMSRALWPLSRLWGRVHDTSCRKIFAREPLPIFGGITPFRTLVEPTPLRSVVCLSTPPR
jgi:hypothetical protein